MPEKDSTRDPTQADFWNSRFEQGVTPWNRGAVPQALINYLHQNPAKHCCLIPGCGHAHEVVFLCEQGWDVTAIDFSAAAVSTAKAQLGKWADRVQQADFFNFQVTHPLSIIYERAFFCALPPAIRASIVTRWASLLLKGGLVIGFFFIDDDERASKRGPPFRTSSVELSSLMQMYFVLEEDRAVADSLAVFEGKERWQVWRRK